MNQLIKGLFAFLIVSPTAILGQSRIVQDSFYSEGLDATIQLNIYLPVAVDELTDLPLYIFLHDCC
jgi:predicted peptidase